MYTHFHECIVHIYVYTHTQEGVEVLGIVVEGFRNSSSTEGKFRRLSRGAVDVIYLARHVVLKAGLQLLSWRLHRLGGSGLRAPD